MSNTNLISALNAISQMVQPLGHKVDNTAAVEVTHADTLKELADALNVENTFNAVFYAVKNTEGAIDIVLDFYDKWATAKHKESEATEE